MINHGACVENKKVIDVFVWGLAISPGPPMGAFVSLVMGKEEDIER